MKQLYIVLTQTGTMLSRILKFVTGAEYNHASVSMSEDLEQMYSFGRLHPYNPFWAGFVKESPHTGTFKRFSKTRAVVLSVEVSEEAYDAVTALLARMEEDHTHYHYNYLGLFLASVHLHRTKANCYYCSEFVKKICYTGRVRGAWRLKPITQPIHFLQLPHQELYCGRLCDYHGAPQRAHYAQRQLRA